MWSGKVKGKRDLFVGDRTGFSRVQLKSVGRGACGKKIQRVACFSKFLKAPRSLLRHYGLWKNIFSSADCIVHRRPRRSSITILRNNLNLLKFIFVKDERKTINAVLWNIHKKNYDNDVQLCDSTGASSGSFTKKPNFSRSTVNFIRE